MTERRLYRTNAVLAKDLRERAEGLAWRVDRTKTANDRCANCAAREGVEPAPPCIPAPAKAIVRGRNILGVWVEQPAWRCVVCGQRWMAGDEQQHRDECEATVLVGRAGVGGPHL